MTKPIEELMEKARLTGTEIRAIYPYWEGLSDDQVSGIKIIAKEQQENDFKAFIQFCGENDCYWIPGASNIKGLDEIEGTPITIFKSMVKPISELFKEKE